MAHWWVWCKGAGRLSYNPTVMRTSKSRPPVNWCVHDGKVTDFSAIIIYSLVLLHVRAHPRRSNNRPSWFHKGAQPLFCFLVCPWKRYISDCKDYSGQTGACYDGLGVGGRVLLGELRRTCVSWERAIANWPKNDVPMFLDCWNSKLRCLGFGSTPMLPHLCFHIS